MEKLTPEQAHAANDLALYTVNTGALYPAAQTIMHKIAGYGRKAELPGDPRNTVHPHWIGHAKLGRASYQKEMGADDHTQLFFNEAVLHAAAFQIAEHYADEQAEIGGNKNA